MSNYTIHDTKDTSGGLYNDVYDHVYNIQSYIAPTQEPPEQPAPAAPTYTVPTVPTTSSADLAPKNNGTA